MPQLSFFTSSPPVALDDGTRATLAAAGEELRRVRILLERFLVLYARSTNQSAHEEAGPPPGTPEAADAERDAYADGLALLRQDDAGYAVLERIDAWERANQRAAPDDVVEAIRAVVYGDEERRVE